MVEINNQILLLRIKTVFDQKKKKNVKKKHFFLNSKFGSKEVNFVRKLFKFAQARN